MSRRPVIQVTAKIGDQNHSVLSVWKSDRIAGMYSVSLDKGTEKYPAINFLTLLKAFAAGGIFVNVKVESETEQRGNSRGSQPNGGGYGGYGGQPNGGGGGGDFGDDDVPFAAVDWRLT